MSFKRVSLSACLGTLTLVLTANTAWAVTRVWNGGGVDDNWMTAANWDAAVNANDTLQFSGATRPTPINNFSNDTTFAGIVFVGTTVPFTLSGNQIILDGGINNQDAGLQTINLSGNGLEFLNNQQIIAAGGDLAIGGTILNVTGSLKTVTFDSSASKTITVSGSIQNGNGPFGVIKNNSGILTLGGANFYSGVTDVNAGTLVMNGSHTGGGLYSVFGGATLSGDGSTASAVSVAASGILAPGTSPGSLGTGSLTLDNASILNWELAAPNLNNHPSSDRVDVTGNLILDGVLNVTALGGFGTPVAGDEWRLFNYTGSLTNSVLTFGTMPTLGAGLFYSIDTSINGQVDLLVNAVPEPNAFAMLLLGSAAMWMVRRKRA